MKEGPFTFQWACFIWVARSTASARRALSSSTIAARVLSAMSIFVGCNVWDMTTYPFLF